jgi:hypothetical protein
MDEFIENLKKLYKAGKITSERLDTLVTKGILETKEKQYIMAPV